MGGGQITPMIVPNSMIRLKMNFSSLKLAEGIT